MLRPCGGVGANTQKKIAVHGRKSSVPQYHLEEVTAVYERTNPLRVNLAH